MIFPRYHQYDVVRKIMADVRQNGVGTNYLIQHSAGSGKSNSIAWIAYRLASVHDAENNGLFDSVIVVTNRVVLDSQLQDTINSFEHQVGLVEAIDDKKNSRSLAEAINDKSVSSSAPSKSSSSPRRIWKNSVGASSPSSSTRLTKDRMVKVQNLSAVV